MSRVLLFIILINTQGVSWAKCHGKFVNPITDICWSCIFPLSIGPHKVSMGGQKDIPNPKSPICFCKKGAIPKVPGISIGFWEPARLVEVTRIPYCMMSLGGLHIGANGVMGRGDVSDENTAHTLAFYQVHYYVYPLIYWLELITDILCFEKANFDVAYLSELDPTWDNDEWNALQNPEDALFANPIAEAACAIDCVKATHSFPIDKLFWCGGCEGGIYPYTGHIDGHFGGVRSSLKLTQRTLGKMHRFGLAYITSADNIKDICQKRLSFTIKKSQYKTQMLYPRAQTNTGSCKPLGHTSLTWEMGREFPYKGEDFSYLIWRKRNCCLL